MEDPLIYVPPQTPRKANTKDNTRSVSNSPQIQPSSIVPSESVIVTPDSSQRTPQVVDAPLEEPSTPSQPTPVHTTPERNLTSSDQIVPQSAATPLSSSNTTKDFFASMINAATTAASTLTSMKGGKTDTSDTKSLSSSPGSIKIDDERRQNSTPRFPQVNQPAMATAATDLSTASAITTNPPGLTLEQLEQINTNSQNNQVNNSSTASDGRAPSDSDGNSSEQADDTSNLSRSASLRKSSRPRSRSDATTDMEDVLGSEGTNLNAAAKKRNADFHNLFKNVPLNEILIEDYSCAIQKDILVHGRMYITEDYVCFYANIFGFVTNIVVEFKEVVAIERRNMAFFVPNAILISTLHNKYLFASFLTREAAFNCLVDLWRKNHPALIENLAYSNSESNLESPYNVGAQPDSESDTGDSGSDEYSEEASIESQEDEEIDTDNDENANPPEDKRGASLLAVSSRPGAVASAEDVSGERKRAQSPSVRNNEGNSITTPETEALVTDPAKKTLCDCYAKDHFESPVLDAILPITLPKVFELLYGDDTQWMENFLTETKNKEVEVSGWSENKRTLVYIKPINAPIGPKQTKCTVTEEIEHKDFDKYVSVVATVSTPDVPNGTYFNPKTRTCLMHAGDGKTRMIVTCGITWHKSSWFKGQIERSTLDGSIEAAKDTENAIKRHLVDNPTNVSATKSSETKKRKKVKKSSPKSSKHEKHESAQKNAAQVSAETQPTSKSLIDLNSLTSSTVIVLSIMAILLISNIISWYQIHTISQQIRSAGISKLHEIPTPQIPKLAISDPESELSTVDFSSPDSSSKTSPPSLQSIGTQLQFVGELLGNIDSEVKRMVTLNEQKNSMV